LKGKENIKDNTMSGQAGMTKKPHSNKIERICRKHNRELRDDGSCADCDMGKRFY